MLAPHDPQWAARAAALVAELRAAAPVFAALHHIGSTAVPGLVAKPVIDLLGEVADLAALEAARPALEAAGWRWRGENGVVGRRYFTLDDPQTRGAGRPPARPRGGRPDDPLAPGLPRPAEGRAGDGGGLCAGEGALRGAASGGQRGLCGMQEGVDGWGGGGGGTRTLKPCTSDFGVWRIYLTESVINDTLGLSNHFAPSNGLSAIWPIFLVLSQNTATASMTAQRRSSSADGSLQRSRAARSC